MADETDFDSKRTEDDSENTMVTFEMTVNLKSTDTVEENMEIKDQKPLPEEPSDAEKTPAAVEEESGETSVAKVETAGGEEDTNWSAGGGPIAIMVNDEAEDGTTVPTKLWVYAGNVPPQEARGDQEGEKVV